MTGGVDQIQLVGLTVLCRVDHTDRVSLDRNAAFAFEVHRVEDLRLHLPGAQGARQLEQTVGERRFAVINVRDDREIADVLDVHEEKEVGVTYDATRGRNFPTSEFNIGNRVTRDHTIGLYEAARDVFGWAAEFRSQGERWGESAVIQLLRSSSDVYYRWPFNDF
jgi:hypothetical protein